MLVCNQNFNIVETWAITTTQNVHGKKQDTVRYLY